MKVLIAAGGTGGHITPGIAIANRLKQEGHEILFVGTKTRMEVDLIPKAGFNIKYIHARGIRRGNVLKNIKTFTELIKGINDVKGIIKEDKIDLVIGTGGYVTAPAMIAAIKLKVPTLIHESNALPGKTTKWLSGKVDRVAVGFEDALKQIPKAKCAVYTGNPTKLQDSYTKEECKKKIESKKPLVLVFGGSQGAKKINETMVEFIKAVDVILQRGDCILIYPEQSMWWNYTKPKPLKIGAYKFAKRNNVPIIPIFITMRDSEIIGEDGFPVQEYYINIEKPIYPNKKLSEREDAEIMRQKNFDTWKKVYEDFYKIPLEYTTVKREVINN